jgi:hypothetical protein
LGASAAHSAIAVIDRAPARTAAAAMPRIATSGWRRPRALLGSGTRAREAGRCGASVSLSGWAWVRGQGGWDRGCCGGRRGRPSGS